ncbi:pentapeptide repeat-containing protein [Tritonibacter mobilis]|nr:pentapeptide repeat-containing protein [Tritonibacter mobilis]
MTDAPEIPEGLRPANENPWYILMTLYGEQEGEEIDVELHKKNRRAWNAWVGQALSAEERVAAAKSSQIKVTELEAWDELGEKIKARFFEESNRRNVDTEGMLVFPEPAKPIWMGNTVFSENLVFENMVIASKVNFGSANFMRNARFGFVTFAGVAVFGSAKFEQEAWFHFANFQKAALFGRARFKDFVYFFRARFGGCSGVRCLPSFAYCQFERPTIFSRALFCDGYPDFSGAVLHDKTSFTARMDPTSDEVAQDKDLEGRTFWPQRTKQDPVSARESCATIRHLLTQQGLPEEAHFFFRREMRFASQIGSFWQRLPYLLFGWLSDFGYSIQRPLWWLAGICFLGMAAFWTVFSFPGGPRSFQRAILARRQR